jgi:hypothetical protein
LGDKVLIFRFRLFTPPLGDFHLYLIIFVPYNLFKLLLVHKISAYKYIYENGKKKWEKKKERDFLLAAPRGGGSA